MEHNFLGGSRWHADCFSCTTCGAKFDGDSSIWVPGEKQGETLLCSSCTYSCLVCEKQIDETAIFVEGDPFCQDCFICGNCEEKIGNLKYARTPQGILCMSCHESLIKRKITGTAKGGTAELETSSDTAES